MSRLKDKLDRLPGRLAVPSAAEAVSATDTVSRLRQQIAALQARDLGDLAAQSAGDLAGDLTPDAAGDLAGDLSPRPPLPHGRGGVRVGKESDRTTSLFSSPSPVRERGLGGEVERKERGLGGEVSRQGEASRWGKPARPTWAFESDHPYAAGHSRLPGEIEDTEYGPLRCVTTPYAEDHQHGSVPVALALSVAARDLSILALDPALEGVDFSRALYIDTETTGLAGGSGTIPFLVGMAWFEGRNLTVEQLLLEKPGHEGPILRRLAERLSRASCIVSYNGKSFDWPLLRTRFILNRVPAPAVPAHLDLLHCARRVYKRRLGAVRLVHLEEQVLGFTRVDDIAGEMIPQTYLGFLRGQVPASALEPIVEHNRSDLVALAAIMGELVRRFSTEHHQDARDSLGYAQVAARAEDHVRAVGLAEQAAEDDVRGELAPQALFLAGQLYARKGDFEAAIQRYEASIEAAAGDLSQAAPARLALAKLFERSKRDLAAALAHAWHTAPAEGDAARDKRVARLSLRIERTGMVRSRA